MKFRIILIALLFLCYPLFVSAHPGNTASDGCHYCRTNCSSWGEAYNVRHCHGGYTPQTTYTRQSTYESNTANKTQSLDSIFNASSNEKDDNSFWWWLFFGGGGIWYWRRRKKKKQITKNPIITKSDEKEVWEKDLKEFNKDTYNDDYLFENDSYDDDINNISEDYGIDYEEASEVQDLADELGIDEDDAYEIWEEL